MELVPSPAARLITTPDSPDYVRRRGELTRLRVRTSHGCAATTRLQLWKTCKSTFPTQTEKQRRDLVCRVACFVAPWFSQHPPAHVAVPSLRCAK